MCSLSLGDFIWAVRPKGEVNLNSPSVFVIDCIAERKTSADLASSIKDGRYEEQKRRLVLCGLETKIYFVEGLSLSVSSMGGGGGGGRAVTSEALKTAIVSTQLNSGISVIRTRGIDHTISSLLMIHRRVQRIKILFK